MSDPRKRFLPDQEHHYSQMRLRVSFMPHDDGKVRIEFLGSLDALPPSPVVFLVVAKERATEISRNSTQQMVGMFTQLLTDQMEACAHIPFLRKLTKQWVDRLRN